MEISLRGRVALITGGSKGLGLAMGRAFAASGGAVALVARGEAALSQARATILAESPAAQVATIAADIATAEGAQAAFDGASQALGRVDILVNNAGTSRTMPFLGASDAVWQQDLDLKLFAAIRLARLVLPSMQERRWGRVINVLNIGAKAPGAGTAPTSVSRAAGMALTKVLANEFAPSGILVNALLVGLIESDQWVQRHAKDPRGLSFEAWAAELGKPVPLGRIGKAEEFANMALFLASEQNGYVTGTAINVDGGRSPVL